MNVKRKLFMRKNDEEDANWNGCEEARSHFAVTVVGRLQHAKIVGKTAPCTGAVHDRNRPKFSGPGWLSSKDQVLKGDSGHYP